MDKHQSAAKIKQAISEGLKDGFEPDVFVRPSPVADYLHVFIVSDAFEKYSLMKRHKIVEQVMKESLYDDPIYSRITLVMPVTQKEFDETYAYVRESDRFFNSSQQVRLRELMDKFHNAVKEGQHLSPEEIVELEALVNAEYQGAAERAAVILKESSQ